MFWYCFVLFCHCFPCLGGSGGHSVILVLFSLLRAGPRRSGSMPFCCFGDVVLAASWSPQVWRSFCCFGNVSYCYVIVFLTSAGLAVILLFCYYFLCCFGTVFLAIGWSRQGWWSFGCSGNVSYCFVNVSLASAGLVVILLFR